jgi:hypothetical protein
VKRLGPTQIIGQVLAWGLFVVLTGVFAQWPRYSTLPEGHGELKLSMAHLTERLEPCVELSPEELAALPPNMRVAERCPRARAHAVLGLRVDGELLLTEAVRPTGLAKGGRTYLQGNWSLPAGDYALELFLRDTPREEGFDKVQHFTLSLAAGESVLLNLGDGDATLIPGSRPDAQPEDLS